MKTSRSASLVQRSPHMGSRTRTDIIWTPAQLFKDKGQGAWYDPSDLTTLFQDSSGTTPLTAVGQSVGLMLDKRLGLQRGAELNTDPLAGWVGGNSAVVSTEGGNLRVTYGGGASPYGYKAFATTPGQWYEFTATVVGSLAADALSSIRVGITGGSGRHYQEALSSGPRTRKAIIQATTDTTYVNLLHTNNVAGGYVDFSGVSLKSLPGNHAIQPTAQYCPTYQVDRGKGYVSVDGIDDSMQAPGYIMTSNWSSGVAARKISSGGRFVFECSVAGANNYLGGTDNNIAVSSPPTGQANTSTIVMNTDFTYAIQVTGQSVGSVSTSLFSRTTSEGSRSFYMSGRVYNLVLVNKALSPVELESLQRFLQKRLPN